MPGWRSWKFAPPTRRVHGPTPASALISSRPLPTPPALKAAFDVVKLRDAPSRTKLPASPVNDRNVDGGVTACGRGGAGGTDVLPARSYQKSPTSAGEAYSQCCSNTAWNRCTVLSEITDSRISIRPEALLHPRDPIPTSNPGEPPANGVRSVLSKKPGPSVPPPGAPKPRFAKPGPREKVT